MRESDRIITRAHLHRLLARDINVQQFFADDQLEQTQIRTLWLRMAESDFTIFVMHGEGSGLGPEGTWSGDAGVPLI